MFHLPSYSLRPTDNRRAVTPCCGSPWKDCSVRNPVVMELLMDGSDGFLEWALDKSLVVIFSMMMCNRSSPPLARAAADMLQGAVQQGQHVLRGGRIE